MDADNNVVKTKVGGSRMEGKKGRKMGDICNTVNDILKRREKHGNSDTCYNMGEP